MSMQEFPDDSLDELFRKSAEEFEPDFEPRAWAAMRKKLDTNDGIQKRPAFVSFLLLLLLISGFSVGGYLLWPHLKTLGTKKSADTSTVALQSQGASAPNQPTATSQNKVALSPDNTAADPDQNALDRQTEGKQVETVSSKAVSPTRISQDKENASENIPASTSDKSRSTNNKKAKITDSGKPVSSESLPRPSTAVTKTERSKVTSDQKVSDRNPVLSTVPSAALLKKRSISNTGSKTGQPSLTVGDRKTNDNVSGSSAKKSDLVTTRQNRSSSTDRPSAAMPASEKSTPQNSTVLTDNNGGETEVTESPINTPNKLLLHPWKFLSVVSAPIDVSYTAPPPPLAIVKKPQTAASPVFRKGLIIRILGAPDLSFIGFDQMKRPGITLGALLEYRFSKRFSIQTGAIRSMKLYDALGSQYKWPETWNSQKARPISVEAACKVLDIPINLRYDISQSVNRRWFVSTGISGYRMLNEKYTYNYPPNAWGIKWRGWEGSTGDYWFGILNLSMGYERQIGKRFTLQAEPYFKVPLAQVGLGKIKLNTTGLYISARYRLGRF